MRCYECTRPIRGAYAVVGSDVICATCLPERQAVDQANAEALAAEQARWERDNPLLAELRAATSALSALSARSCAHPRVAWFNRDALERNVYACTSCGRLLLYHELPADVVHGLDMEAQ